MFISTHDLFLLRELELRRRDYKDVSVRFIGLHEGDVGVKLEQGDSIDDLGEIVSLEENADQSNRYLSLKNLV